MTPQPAKSAPERIVLEGNYVRLEPVDQRHAADLFAVSTMEGGAERYRWLFSDAPKNLGEMEARIAASDWNSDTRYVAIIDKASGKALGQQGWMRIRPEHGSIEIGGV